MTSRLNIGINGLKQIAKNLIEFDQSLKLKLSIQGKEFPDGQVYLGIDNFSNNKFSIFELQDFYSEVWATDKEDEPAIDLDAIEKLGLGDVHTYTFGLDESWTFIRVQ